MARRQRKAKRVAPQGYRLLSGWDAGIGKRVNVSKIQPPGLTALQHKAGAGQKPIPRCFFAKSTFL